MPSPFLDPRGEYSKQCPYCLEYITVNHLNRQFCPEKNGIKNFCKNRFKRLKNNVEKRGLKIDKPAPTPLKISITRKRSLAKKTIDDSIHDDILSRNQQILEKLIGSKDHAEVALNTLEQQGYEILGFHSEINTKSGLKVYIIGRFAIALIESETYYVTYYHLISTNLIML